MPKQTFPQIYLVPFCSSKLVHFFNFLSEKVEVLRTSVFLNSKCLTCFYLKEHPLKASNKRTHIPLLINLFISLIEPEHQLKYQIKQHTCKQPTQSCSLEQHMTLAKISL